MTVLEALAILEAGVLECKKEDIDTPEMRAALDFLEPYIQPAWLLSKASSRFFALLSQESVTEFENFSECERMH